MKIECVFQTKKENSIHPVKVMEGEKRKIQYGK